MRSILISSAAALITITAPGFAHSADQDIAKRFYGGLSLGASRLPDSDTHGSVFKLYGGYQITENFGAEAGFIRLGDIKRTSGTGDDAFTQVTNARAFYSAGTARWQLSDSFSVNGLLGASYNQMTGDDRTSVMLGLGAQYRLTPRTELTVNVDHLAEVSEKGSSSDIVTAGFVMRF
jgi:OOP family OmpA-OmpF porin